MATSNDSTTYVGGYNTTAASNVPPDNGATGKRFQGAAEIRQLKKVLKDSFPSVTGAVTATHTQLNKLANDAITVDGSNQVGINDTSPQTQLHVKQSADTGDGGFRLSRTNQAASWSQWVDSGATFNIGYGNPDSATPSSVFVIDNAGQVGIATTSPSAELDVVGDVEVTGNISVGGDGVVSAVRLTASTNIGVNETTPDYNLDVNGTFGFTPGSSVTPADNGDVVFELTNNTTLTIKAKGSDGTVRTGTITLA